MLELSRAQINWKSFKGNVNTARVIGDSGYRGLEIWGTQVTGAQGTRGLKVPGGSRYQGFEFSGC